MPKCPWSQSKVSAPNFTTCSHQDARLCPCSVPGPLLPPETWLCPSPTWVPFLFLSLMVIHHALQSSIYACFPPGIISDVFNPPLLFNRDPSFTHMVGPCLLHFLCFVSLLWMWKAAQYVRKLTGSGTEPQLCHLIAVWPWASYLTSLDLGFLI